jgi:hypothetical protein
LPGRSRRFGDEGLFWAVVEPIWPDASVNDESPHIAKGTPGQQAIYATTLFAREIDNGGLAQFLGNSSGIYTNTVIEGFQRLGAHELLEPLLAGLSVFFGGEVPVDSEARRQRIYRLSDSELQFFDNVDNRLYQGSSVERRLCPYFKRYIDAHSEDFFKE